MGDCSIAQGAQLCALWCHRWLKLGVGEEGTKGRQYMRTCSWFSWLCSRNYHNILKQSFQLKKKKVNYPLKALPIFLLFCWILEDENSVFSFLFISLIKTPIPKAARWNALTEGSLQGILRWPESAAESILCLWAGILEKLLTEENRISPLAEYNCACCYTRHSWGISLLCSGSFTSSWKDARWITPENRSGWGMICRSIF